MPLYEFRCLTCARDFEVLSRRDEQVQCPQCGTPRIEKLLSEAAVPVAGGNRALSVAPACPPGDAPCSPTCCRL